MRGEGSNGGRHFPGEGKRFAPSFRNVVGTIAAGGLLASAFVVMATCATAIVVGMAVLGRVAFDGPSRDRNGFG